MIPFPRVAIGLFLRWRCLISVPDEVRFPRCVLAATVRLRGERGLIPWGYSLQVTERGGVSRFSRRRLLVISGGTALAALAVACGGQPELEKTPPDPELPSVAVQDVPVQESAGEPVRSGDAVPVAPETAAEVPTAGLLAGLRPLEGYGFQAHLYNQDRALIARLTREAGFNWIKQQVWWKFTEPVEKGGYDWAELDKVVGDVSAAGLNLLLSIVQAPEWALEDRDHGPPANPADFKDFMAAVANRYFGRVQAYEIWNETNFAREWGVLDEGAYRAYGELLKAGYEGVKGVDPDATVVFGAPTPTGVADPNIAMDDALYLERVYEAMPEIGNYYDAMGAHPPGYNNAPDQPFGADRGEGWNGHNSFYFLRFTDYRRIMEEHGDGDKPIWFTEFGWSTTNQSEGYGYGKDNTEEDQAKFLLGAFELIRRDYPYVTHMFVWNLNFQMVVGPEDEKYPFGLLRSDGSPRPGFLVLKGMDEGL